MKRILTLIYFVLVSLSLSGQLTPVSNQYILNPLTINPAYAGSRGALNIAVFYRRQWVGINGAPETMTLALDAPFFDSKLGLGITVVNDKIGVTKDTQFRTDYAYRIHLGRGNMSFGLGAGLITTNTAWSDLVVLDQGDDYFLIDSRVFVVPDFSFGVYYSFNDYFIGVSVPKLLVYDFDLKRNKYSQSFDLGQNYYLLNTGYTFSLSSKFKFSPSTLLTYKPGNDILYDINAHASIFNRIWFGASYRNRRSVGTLFQFAVNNQLRIGYTYDFDVGKLGRYNNGSHEIMLRYEFIYKVNASNPLKF